MHYSLPQLYAIILSMFRKDETWCKTGGYPVPIGAFWCNAVPSDAANAKINKRQKYSHLHSSVYTCSYRHIDISLLIELLLASESADFVVTGCSSGKGMMLAALSCATSTKTIFPV